MVVSQAWPSSLISVLALGLPLWSAYFPLKLHVYFNSSKAKVDKWYSTREFSGPIADNRAVYLLSGSSEFIRGILQLLPSCQRLFITVEWSRRSALRSKLARALKSGYELLALFHFTPLLVANAAVGGATNSVHLLGFGADLGSQVTPFVEVGLPRTICHFS